MAKQSFAAKKRQSVSRRVIAAFAGVLVAAALTGCASGDKLADVASQSPGSGYVSGDGSTTSFAPEQRTAAVEFEGVSETGETISSKKLKGAVTVVNFWYAGCAPCRAEAADLVAAATKHQPEGVHFIGVNTRDQKAQALEFATEFKVPYPSILDAAAGRKTQAAFAGQVPLNAVPTTLILDRKGRVAHRILGQLASASQLDTLIRETLAETE